MISFLTFLFGLSVVVLTRVLILAQDVQGAPNPFSSTHLYSSDILATLILAGLVCKPAFWRRLPNWLGWIVIAGSWSVFQSNFPLQSYAVLIRVLLYTLTVYSILLPFSLRLQKSYFRGLVGAYLLGGLMALFQTIHQHSLPFPYLLQPVLNPNLAGVAKVDWFGTSFLRASGTLPHPNILAFMGVMALWLLYTRYIEEHHLRYWKLVGFFIIGVFASLDHFFLTSTQGFLILVGASFIITSSLSIQIRSFWWNILSIFSWVLLVAAFSRTGLILAMVLVIGVLTQKRVSKMFHVEHLQKPTILLIAGIMSVASQYTLLALPGVPSASNRLFFIKQSLGVFRETSGKGIGLGQFVHYLPDSLPFWRYQPVHSIPILLILEVGWGFVLVGLYEVLKRGIYRLYVK